jgi:hypothetical protein
MLSVRRYNLTRAKLLFLLEELKTVSAQAASMCVPPGLSKEKIENNLAAVLDIKNVPEDLSKSMAESPTGGIVFWGPDHWYLIMPPFPMEKESSANSCDIEPLYTLLHRDCMIAIVLLRLGEFGIGVYQGEKLVTSKVGTGLVHSRHRQGGSSAHRFERHREKQMETFFSRVCEHTKEQLYPYSRQVEYLLYGGTQETVAEFRNQCHYLHEFDDRTLDRLLNIREPKQSGLEEGIREAWSSRIIQWNEK